MSDKPNEYCVVLTTFADEDNGDLLVDLLVGDGLAASVQILPVQSHSIWRGKVSHMEEFLMLIKTKSSRYAEVEQMIVEYHTYPKPEVIRLGVDAGYGKYLGWIDEVLPG